MKKERAARIRELEAIIERIDDGELIADIAREYRMPSGSLRSTINRYIRGNDRPNRIVTESREERLRKLHTQGHTDPVMASRLGIARSIVYRIRERMGLKANK